MSQKSDQIEKTLKILYIETQFRRFYGAEWPLLKFPFENEALETKSQKPT